MRRVRCPECDTTAKVPDDHQRSFIHCSSCGEKIRLDQTDGVSKEGAQDKAQSSGCVVLTAYAMTGLAVLACVVVAFFLPVAGFLMGVLLGIAVGVVAGVAGLVAWGIAAARGGRRFRALAPWLGLQALGILIFITPIALHGISQKAGWFAAKAPDDEFAKGAGNGAPLPKDGPANQDVQEAPNVNVEKPVPLKWSGDAALDKTLADLANQDGNRFKPAIDSLIAMAPNEHRAVVAQHLAEQLKVSPLYNRTPLLRAMGSWATPQETPVLIKVLSDQDINTRNEALQALGKLRDPRAAGPMARCLLELSTRYHAEQSLKAMGPIAETEVLALLKQKDMQVTVIAIRILADIGTQQSVPELHAAAKGSIALRSPAQQALAAIGARTKE